MKYRIRLDWMIAPGEELKPGDIVAEIAAPGVLKFLEPIQMMSGDTLEYESEVIDELVNSTLPMPEDLAEEDEEERR